MVVLGLARSELGIDIETIRPGWFGPGLIARVFSPREQALIEASADPERTCFRLWVRKEACVKALGTGLNNRLDSFDVVDDTCVPHGAGSALRCHDLAFADGYLGAVAVRAASAFALTIREGLGTADRAEP
jgi:4'-phosphopantetheinyl transferase